MPEPLTTPAFNFQGVNFWIADLGADRPGIDSEYSDVDGTLNLNLRVAWEDRYAARDALIGKTEFVNTALQYGYLQRQLPHCYTDESDMLWCRRVSILPEISREATPGVTGNVPGALYANLKARYETRPYELLEDGDVFGENGFPDEGQLTRYVSFPAPKSKSRVGRGSVGAWKFDGDPAGLVLPEGIPIIQNDIEQVVVWHRVPRANVPILQMLSLKGHANGSIFMGRPVGTLVYSDWSWQLCPRVFPEGEIAVDVYHVFVDCPNGANYYPDSRRGDGYRKVVAADGSGRQPYPEDGDFRFLFRPVAAS